MIWTPPGYRNETPVHPSRGFEGREQVRGNWQCIFTGLSDVTATVLRTAVPAFFGQRLADLPVTPCDR